MNKPINLLFILPNIIQGNGVFSFCWNYLRFISNDDFAVSVVTIDREPSLAFCDFCKVKNIPLYLLPDPWRIGYQKHRQSVVRFFKKHHDFTIAHCNIPNYGFFYLHEAKKYGIPIRILHSHNTESSDVFWKKEINKAGSLLTRRFATDYFACSNAAGVFAFKKKPFTIVHNAVDQSRFSYSANARDDIRNKLRIPKSAFVVGFVGRLDIQKNPLFLISIFYSWIKSNPNSYCVIVGNGPMLLAVKKKVEENGLSDRVLFAGVVQDASPWYSAFDVFVLPSLFEGLVLSGIEAQSVGVPCVFSSGSSSELLFKKNAAIIGLKEGPSLWCEEIQKVLTMPNEIIPENDTYDIRKEAIKLCHKYIELTKKIL